MKRAILTTAAIAALLLLTFTIVVVTAFHATTVRPLTVSTEAVTSFMFLVALAALLITVAAAEWARSHRRSADPNRRPSVDAWQPPPRRAPPARQQFGRLRRSKEPWAPTANPSPRSSTAATPTTSDPMSQAAELSTAVVPQAAALESVPRSEPDQRLVRELREVDRATAKMRESDPPPPSLAADAPPKPADAPPAPARPPSSGRTRRHLTWLIQRQRGRCGICGQPLPQPPTGDVVHVDHIVPRVRGGTDQRSNLQATHAACNLTKGSLGARRPPPGYSRPVLPPA